MRGTHLPQTFDAEQARFIPARAGNTTIVPSLKDDYSVHPRTCGEHTFSRVLSTFLTGSSPHVRGTQRGVAGIKVVGRFIPARAGNTPSVRR
ncbi:conserved hypothetical protein [Gluconacetobacter diazotrophicus PA1 5]|nr:conserved hypothetical protein [Gluconacetobacter diazotrophicus PA1 5]